MKLRITGTAEDRAQLIQALRNEGYQFQDPEKEYTAGDLRERTVYIDIQSEHQKVCSNLQDWQVLEYCNNFATKAGVARNFGVTFEEAEEILDRLAASGALLKWVVDKRYEYLDARYSRFVQRKCGNCDHRTGWGDCALNEHEGYCKVGDTCSKFEPSRWAFYDIINEKNYSAIKEEH